jgi:hypothetical protein
VTVNKKKNKIAGIAVCSRSRFFSRPGKHEPCASEQREFSRTAGAYEMR